MKKELLMTIAATALLFGCSGKPKLPESCLALVDTLSEIAKMDPSGSAMAGMSDPKEMIKELEEKWGEMSDAERKEAEQQCEQVKGMMDMIKNMGQLGNN